MNCCLEIYIHSVCVQRVVHDYRSQGRRTSDGAESSAPPFATAQTLDSSIAYLTTSLAGTMHSAVICR